MNKDQREEEIQISIADERKMKYFKSKIILNHLFKNEERERFSLSIDLIFNLRKNLHEYLFSKSAIKKIIQIFQ